MSMVIYHVAYHVVISVMYFFKALFGIGSLWYIVNGVINAAIVFMLLLYLVAFMQSIIRGHPISPEKHHF